MKEMRAIVLSGGDTVVFLCVEHESKPEAQLEKTSIYI